MSTLNLHHLIKIHIGKNVLTADKVYISDCIHTYNDINFPVMNQEVISLNEIKIGDHSWLGENVVIIGASVGKHCIIGSNSVVTNDIPDYSVAVGAPARVIKRYDFDNHKIQGESCIAPADFTTFKKAPAPDVSNSSKFPNLNVCYFHINGFCKSLIVTLN